MKKRYIPAWLFTESNSKEKLSRPYLRMRPFFSMAKLKTKKTVKRRRPPLNSGLWLVLSIVVVLILAFIFADRGMVKYWQARDERNELLREIEELKERKEQLIREKELLEKNLQYIEKVAREKYKMKKPGEKVYEVAPDE